MLDLEILLPDSDQVLAGLEELARRDRERAKAEQSELGWYDGDGIRQGGLIAFVRYFWHVLEPSNPFVDGWPLWAMCEHLEAVTAGDITRLLINIPPGHMKSMLVNVFWPAWEWGARDLPHLRYVCFSYSAHLTERDNAKFRDLISSPDFVALYGERVRLRNQTVTKVWNDSTGWKLASSVGGVGTGERGDRVIIDDPHNVTESESEQVRGETLRWFRESISSRFNNLDTGALVIIMQRVHEEDISGSILELGLEYCHLMIPWEYDATRRITTDIGWTDPRSDEDNPDLNDGAPAWPERFSAAAIARTRKEITTFAWAAQYQQAPAPRGGGIFQREWWQLWESPDGKFPPLESVVIASLDGAFTSKEENDPCALTIWGTFTKQSFETGRIDEKTGTLWEDENVSRSRIILLHAWRKHLKFSAPIIPMKKGESWQAYKWRTQDEWGLIEWVADTCQRFHVTHLLVEAKGPGMSACQELVNRFPDRHWVVMPMQVKGDKVSRALACQPTFTQGLVFAPDRDWAQLVIDEMAVFPKGRYDDLTDSATQAINYLRRVGLARTDTEEAVADMERLRHRKKLQPLYPV